MFKIKVSTNFPDWPFIRQTPKSEGMLGNCKFFINQDIEDCDFWIVDGDLVKTEQTFCPKENTIFIAGEPPTIKSYNKNFLNQFNYVITCDKKLHHSNKFYNQQAIPWQIGAYIDKYGYDELKSLKKPEKNRIISVITTNKDWTSGHKKRIEFIFKLKEYFGDSLDVFGRGINEIRDKSMGILSYKYSIAIENSNFDNYWTEKLSDAFLGFSFPFYYGCPNIYDYFPQNSLRKIDIDDFDGSIKIIEKAIEDNCFENHFNEIVESRLLILDKYNFFSMMAGFCNKYYKKSEKIKILLKPERNFEKYNFKKYFNCKKIFLYVKKRFFNK
ncbi:MAG: hypothetical protein E3J83_01165 [Candidatus Atribacteria bacterium]|nr:MAG: hypothetical protein E3J83_01165 [Candidatus Atribacteria bacterium]